MSPQELNAISLSVQTPSNAKTAYAPRENTAAKESPESLPVEDIYTQGAYSLELSETTPKEPADYSKRHIPSADGSSFNEPYPVIKVRVPINELIVVSVKPREAPPAKEGPGTAGLDSA